MSNDEQLPALGTYQGRDFLLRSRKRKSPIPSDGSPQLIEESISSYGLSKEQLSIWLEKRFTSLTFHRDKIKEHFDRFVFSVPEALTEEDRNEIAVLREDENVTDQTHKLREVNKTPMDPAIAIPMLIGPIQNIAKDCETSFIHCLRYKELRSLEDQLGRFRLWAANIGVFENSRASLDHRLRQNESTREMVMQLLQVLRLNIGYCLQIEANFIKPTKTTTPAPYSTGDSSDFSSESSFSDETVETNKPSTIANVVKEVESLIGRLQRISNAIRFTSKGRHNLRIADLIITDPIDMELQNELKKFSTSMLSIRYPQSSEGFRCLMLDAILIRQKRFIYFAMRRAHVNAPLPNIQHEAPQNQMQQNIHLPHTPLAFNRAQDQPNDVSSSDMVFELPPKSRFTATTLPNQPLVINDRPSKSSAKSVRSLLQDGNLAWPLPPKLTSTGGEQQCPYCFDFLTEEELIHENLWREHVKQDLEPYTCCSCAGGSKSIKTFASYEAWLEHTREFHASREWLCTFKEHRKTPFYDLKDFKNHMIEEHHDTFKVSQLDMVAKMNSRPAVKLFTECPFCGGLPDDLISDKQEGNGKPDGLPKHISGHLKEIALWSLLPAEERSSFGGSKVTPQAQGSIRDWDFEEERLKQMIPPRLDDNPSEDDIEPLITPSHPITLAQEESYKRTGQYHPSTWDATWGYLIPKQSHMLPFDDPKLHSFVERAASAMNSNIRDFHNILQANNFFTPSNQSYVRFSQLEHYMTGNSIDDFSMRDILDIENDNDDFRPWFRIICILSLLDACTCFINFMRSTTYDSDLPLSFEFIENLITLGYPNRGAAAELAKLFYDTQWRFCPAQFTYLEESLIVTPGLVRPIYHQERINHKGGVADLFRIEIMSEFVDPKLQDVAENNKIIITREVKGNREKQPSVQPSPSPRRTLTDLDRRMMCQYHEDNPSVKQTEIGALFGIERSTVSMVLRQKEKYLFPENPRLSPVKRSKGNLDLISGYVFALKTFRGKNKGIYENEKAAYQALGSHEGIVPYFGSYVTTDSDSQPTYNILLEYGDLDLAEYFRSNNPPILQEEIRRFWSALFVIVDAVSRLHNFARTDEAGTQAMQGWHSDIKPDNILYVGGKFKLGDPGFAYFVQKTEEFPKAALLGGTETYGAPEQYRNGKGQRNSVSQTIDVWSLGCVFSLAATWLVLGYPGVQDFNKRRGNGISRAIKQAKSGLLGVDLIHGDYFHDGETVLTEVTKWHQILRENFRSSDTITPKVLDIVDREMLLADSTNRTSAHNLYSKLIDTLDSLPNDRNLRHDLSEDMDDIVFTESGSSKRKAPKKVDVLDHRLQAQTQEIFKLQQSLSRTPERPRLRFNQGYQEATDVKSLNRGKDRFIPARDRNNLLEESVIRNQPKERQQPTVLASRRHAMTETQIKLLTDWFNSNSNPTDTQLYAYADLTDLKRDEVRNWFENRRRLDGEDEDMGSFKVFSSKMEEQPTNKSRTKRRVKSHPAQEQTRPQDEMVQDHFPMYDLPRDTLRKFLESLFRDVLIDIKMQMDNYVFHIPRKLTQEERDTLDDMRSGQGDGRWDSDFP